MPAQNDQCHGKSKDHLAVEVHDQLDSHEVKILTKKHPGNTATPKATDKRCYPQLKNSAVVDASGCNDSKTDVLKRSKEEGNWNSMSENSSQEEKMRFFVMFTLSSVTQAQRASQELSTVCEDSENEICQLVTQRETSTCSSRLRSS